MKAAIVLSFFCIIATAYSHSVCNKHGPNKSPVFPNKSDCSKYYQCNKGQLTSRQCRDGLLYNPKYARCVLPQDSECSNYQKYIEERNIEYCAIYGESALFPNVLSCDKFYECANGVPVQFNCPSGLVFNDRTKVCDYPNQTVCLKWLQLPLSAQAMVAEEIIEVEQVDDLVEEEVAYPDEYGIESQE